MSSSTAAPALPAQELPDYLSYSLLPGNEAYTVVYLPLTYYGAGDVSLGDGWVYGGSTSPTATPSIESSASTQSPSSAYTSSSASSSSSTPSTTTSSSTSSTSSSSSSSLSSTPTSTPSSTSSLQPSSSSSGLTGSQIRAIVLSTVLGGLFLLLLLLFACLFLRRRRRRAAAAAVTSSHLGSHPSDDDVAAYGRASSAPGAGLWGVPLVGAILAAAACRQRASDDDGRAYGHGTRDMAERRSLIENVSQPGTPTRNGAPGHARHISSPLLPQHRGATALPSIPPLAPSYPNSSQNSRSTTSYASSSERPDHTLFFEAPRRPIPLPEDSEVPGEDAPFLMRERERSGASLDPNRSSPLAQIGLGLRHGGSGSNPFLTAPPTPASSTPLSYASTSGTPPPPVPALPLPRQAGAPPGLAPPPFPSFPSTNGSGSGSGASKRSLYSERSASGSMEDRSVEHAEVGTATPVLFKHGHARTLTLGQSSSGEIESLTGAGAAEYRRAKSIKSARGSMRFGSGSIGSLSSQQSKYTSIPPSRAGSSRSRRSKDPSQSSSHRSRASRSGNGSSSSSGHSKSSSALSWAGSFGQHAGESSSFGSYQRGAGTRTSRVEEEEQLESTSEDEDDFGPPQPGTPSETASRYEPVTPNSAGSPASRRGTGVWAGWRDAAQGRGWW